MFVEVLKGFAFQIQQKFPILLPKSIFHISWTFYKVGSLLNYEIHHMVKTSTEPRKRMIENIKIMSCFFLIPSSCGDQQEVLQQFKKFLHQVFLSSHFFILMESFMQTLPYEGGQIGKHLRNKDSDSWKTNISL
jgi:hypothetical protein